MFNWLFGGNEALIKENQELRRELMELKRQELLRNLLPPVHTLGLLGGGGLGLLDGGGGLSAISQQQQIYHKAVVTK